MTSVIRTSLKRKEILTSKANGQTALARQKNASNVCLLGKENETVLMNLPKCARFFFSFGFIRCMDQHRNVIKTGSIVIIIIIISEIMLKLAFKTGTRMANLTRFGKFASWWFGG